MQKAFGFVQKWAPLETPMVYHLFAYEILVTQDIYGHPWVSVIFGHS